MPGLRDLCLKPEVLYESAKFKELRTLLPDLVRTQGRRVLLFSQWTRLLDLMVELCNDLDLGTCRLDGNTPIAERQGMVAAFNDGTSSAKIFLLSTRAGGLGINLTGADTVIFYESDWNPTMDLQAMDRAHRIGQTSKVTYIDLIAPKTIDEKIVDALRNKIKIADLVLGEAAREWLK